LAAFLIALSANVTAIEGGLVFRVLVNCSTAFAAAAVLAEHSAAFPKSARVWQFFGWAGFLVCLYLLTFPGIKGNLLGCHDRDLARPAMARALYQWMPLALSITVWGIVAWRSRLGSRKNDESEGVGV